MQRVIVGEATYSDHYNVGGPKWHLPLLRVALDGKLGGLCEDGSEHSRP